MRKKWTEVELYLENDYANYDRSEDKYRILLIPLPLIMLQKSNDFNNTPIKMMAQVTCKYTLEISQGVL